MGGERDTEREGGGRGRKRKRGESGELTDRRLCSDALKRKTQRNGWSDERAKPDRILKAVRCVPGRTLALGINNSTNIVR